MNVIKLIHKSLLNFPYFTNLISWWNQEAENCRAQILEVKGPACPVVVVLNKTDLIRSGSVSSEPQTDDDKNEQQHGAGGSSGGSDGGTFLCQEMVESLVTCDWGHGFVPASAKNNINVVQVIHSLYESFSQFCSSSYSYTYTYFLTWVIGDWRPATSHASKENLGGEKSGGDSETDMRR